MGLQPPPDQRRWRAGDPHVPLQQLSFGEAGSDGGMWTSMQVEVDDRSGAGQRNDRVTVQLVARSPTIATVDHFASDEECAALIALAEPQLRRSTTAQSVPTDPPN